MTAIPSILIVDDEALARRRMRDVLDDIAKDFPHNIAGEASHGREAIERVNLGGVTIVLLDIQMPVMDGMEAAHHWSQMGHPPQIIFTTAFDQHALEAFEVNAVDYLLKPIAEAKLLAALKKAVARHEPQREALAKLTLAQGKERRHLSAHDRGRIQLIPIDDVLYLRAELKYVTVRTALREYLIEDSLTKLEEEFGERFVRIHRNCLVARAHVQGFERVNTEEEHGWAVIVKVTEEKLMVSRRQAHIVKELRHE